MALRILNTTGEDNASATWIVDWEGNKRGKQGAVKWSILEQLGRMSRSGYNDETVRDFAAAICEHRLTVKDAAERLRKFRLRDGAAPA